MMPNEKLLGSNRSSLWWKARLRSFGYAWEGILSFFRWEQNAQIHLAATLLVLVLSVTLRVSKVEAIAVVFSIAFVWIAEMFNTAIEKAMDFATMERHPEIKLIKDISAGAVLVASITAVIIGCIVFIPKLVII